MAIGWSIEIGYISGYSTHLDRDDALMLLQAEARAIMRDAKRIYDECKRIDIPDTTPEEGYTLMDVCETFNLDWSQGGCVHIKGDCIHLMASGGERFLKEETRRAFVRMIVEAMHRYHVDVNVVAA